MIRRATASDCDVLNKFITEFVKFEADEYDINNRNDLIFNNYFQSRVNNEDCIVLVWEEDNKIVGLISGRVIRGNLVKKTDEGKIEVVSVISNYQNRGIGTQLIEQFIEECKKKGIKFIRMDNFLKNERAASLYEKLGFEPLVIERRKAI